MKHLLFICFFVKCLSVPSESMNLKDLGQSAVDIAIGVAEKVPDAIPSAEDLFQLGINGLAGYPFETVIST